METLLLNTLNGLSWGMLLFMIAAGLTTVFGVMGILNFAHGSLFMLGAYLCLQAMQLFDSFWFGLLVGPLCVVVLGIIIEKYFLKRIYSRDVPYQLLLTFAILLVLDDAVRMIWGSGYYVIEPPISARRYQYRRPGISRLPLFPDCRRPYLLGNTLVVLPFYKMGKNYPGRFFR